MNDLSRQLDLLGKLLNKLISQVASLLILPVPAVIDKILMYSAIITAVNGFMALCEVETFISWYGAALCTIILAGMSIWQRGKDSIIRKSYERAYKKLIKGDRKNAKRRTISGREKSGKSGKAGKSGKTGKSGKDKKTDKPTKSAKPAKPTKPAGSTKPKQTQENTYDKFGGFAGNRVSQSIGDIPVPHPTKRKETTGTPSS